ncbi:universal stress protein [Streptomyces luteogriseus]|uniref:universal stress protein n=1 Tax=Streptomyces luteogriseus TaxID=68233 RepID=UPI00379FEF62
MDQPVTVDAGGREASPRAVGRAVGEAAPRAVPPHAPHASSGERYEHAVFPTVREPPPEQPLTGFLAVTAAQHLRARVPALEAVIEAAPEGRVPVLCGAARETAVLVPGSRGRGSAAEQPLGSFGLAAIGRADGPVVVVRGPRRDLDDPSGSRTPNRPVVGVPAGPADSEALRSPSGRRPGGAYRSRPYEPGNGPRTRFRPPPLHRCTRAGAPEGDRRGCGDRAARTGLRAPGRVQARRRIVGGRARTVLVDISAGAAPLVVGARHPTDVPVPTPAVTHAVLHDAPRPVTVVPEEETS